jgi:hypothetical protein
MPKSYARVLEMARSCDSPLSTAERQVLGVDHLSAGRRLAELWGLAPAVSQAAWLHHQPAEALPKSLSDGPLISVVALADAVACLASGRDEPGPHDENTVPSHLASLGLGNEDWQQLRQQAPLWAARANEQIRPASDDELADLARLQTAS